MKKIVHIISTAFFAFFMILMIFLAYGSIDNRWYRVVTVKGNSMSPTLWIGDMIVVTPPQAQIEPGTIVVMRVAGELVTHRLIGFDANHRPITQGDANDSADGWQNPDLQIVGVFQMRLPGFGYPILYLSQLLGLSS
jgi:signal peptidase I